MQDRIYQLKLIQAIRNFFNQNDFLDVLTPPAVENPGMESHIHPFQLYSLHHKQTAPLYLHTSPEFMMKELLRSSDLENIYTLTYCFRDEPLSDIHRSQFIMLEWYRKNAHYEKIMEDTKNLIDYCQSFFEQEKILKNKIYSFPQVTIQDLFYEYLNFNILEFLTKNDLKQKIQKDFKDVPLPSVDCEWDDYYFLLFLNKIEPKLAKIPYILIKEFPAPLAALSTLKSSDNRVAERFEVYLSGIEICNCFNELTSYQEQIHRFQKQAKLKKDLYQYELPWPKRFLKTLELGLPKSSGIALGVERLYLALSKTQSPFFD